MLVIVLTTAWDPGTKDSPNTYPHCKVTAWSMRESNISFSTQYGTGAGAVWTPGTEPETTHHVIVGTDLDTIRDATSAAADEKYTEEIERDLYDWLIANGHEVGTITAV